MLTMGSLFDGIGGFPLAAQQNGIEPKWLSEIEPFPYLVGLQRFPQTKHYGDVSKLSGEELEPVDIVTFGSPCQDMSVAGKRAGLDGERSGLFHEAIRIIKEMRSATNGRYPRYAVWENVPGAFTSNSGEDFRCVLEALCQVKAPDFHVPGCKKWIHAGSIMADGFSIAWRVLDAQYWGVPQHRERIFLVTDFAGDSAAKVLFKPESVSGDSQKNKECRETTSGTTADSSAKTNWGELGGAICIQFHPSDTRLKYSNVCQTLISRMGTGGNNVPLCMGDTQGHSTPAVNKAQTLMAKNYKEPPVVCERIVRRLTPTECLRLQGFPDDWLDVVPVDTLAMRPVFDDWCDCQGLRHKTDNQIAKWISQQPTDSAKYKAIGNSVAVPCVDFVMAGIRRESGDNASD